MYESKQVGIDQVCICRAHAMRISGIDLECAVLEQLGLNGVLAGYDPVVVALHDERRHVDRFQKLVNLDRRARHFAAASLGAVLAAFFFASSALCGELDLPRERVSLVAPPFVHPHEQATTQAPKVMEFKLVVEEKRVVIDDEGTTIQAMTFNGTIPGPMMVVHEGDYVEVTLVNPSTNVLVHNIDLHAATGGPRRRLAHAGQSR